MCIIIFIMFSILIFIKVIQSRYKLAKTSLPEQTCYHRKDIQNHLNIQITNYEILSYILRN